MKILILSILVAVVVDGSKRDEIYQLANSAVEEIAKRENMDLYLESLDSYRTKRKYSTRTASNFDTYDLQMTARSFNDDPVNCRASINLDEATGRMNLNGYSVQNQQQNGFFRKRSGGAPCTPKESQDATQRAMNAINEGVEQGNEMDEMMGMPELEQSKFELESVVSCTKAVTANGDEFTLKLKATQNSLVETCDVTVVRDSNQSWNVEQNQCQGQN